MTPAQKKKQLVRIISTWADRLKMHAWELDVEWGEDPDDEDALASVSPSDLYDYARLRFRSDWPTHGVDALNRIVVHELLHVLFRDYGNAIRSIGIVGLSGDARAIWHDRCHDSEEGVIDRLANRFVEIGGVVE